jgi:hypothetical protein
MPNSLWRVVLIAVVSVALDAPAQAESLDTAGKQIVAGIVVVSAALAVGVTLLVFHEKHKTGSITGCVSSGPGLVNITDEKDKRTYRLAGDPVGVKVGDRMTLEGKRRKEGGNPVFQAHSVTRDFGACQP